VCIPTNDPASEANIIGFHIGLDWHFRHGTSATVIAGNGSNESLPTGFSPLQLVPRRIHASASESFVTIPLFLTAVICILDMSLGPPTCFSLDSRFFCNHTVSPHIKKLSKNCRSFHF